MSPKLTQRTALLLIAVLALLPLRGVYAALDGLTAPDSAVAAGDNHAGHGMHRMAAMPDCPMHPPSDQHTPSGQCSGGCDMCGACTAAMLPLLQLDLVTGRQLPSPAAEISALPRPAYPLFRPPRA